MRILVIGHAGQVATALRERGEATGRDVVCRGRPEADLLDPASLTRAVDEVAPTVVVNAAAYTAVDAAEEDEAAARALNATGPGVLANLCAARGIPFAHISTDYVFDGTLDRPYREDDPVAPQSAYGRTKAAGEAAVAQAGGKALVLRTAWVYAPFGKNFVRTMLRVGAERDHLRSTQSATSRNSTSPTAIPPLGAPDARWPDGPGHSHPSAGAGETNWQRLRRGDLPFRPTTRGWASQRGLARRPERPANSCLDGGKPLTNLRASPLTPLARQRANGGGAARRLRRKGRGTGATKRAALGGPKFVEGDVPHRRGGDRAQRTDKGGDPLLCGALTARKKIRHSAERGGIASRLRPRRAPAPE